MENKKGLKSERQILLNARRDVIMSFIILLAWLFIPLYSIYPYLGDEAHGGICTLLLLIHASLCGRLYFIISKNILKAIGIFLAILILSWFAIGVGMYILTIYLLVKSSNLLKKK